MIVSWQKYVWNLGKILYLSQPDLRFTQPSAFPPKNIKKKLSLFKLFYATHHCWIVGDVNKSIGGICQGDDFFLLNVNLVPKRHLTILTAKNKNRFSLTEFSQTFKPYYSLTS